MANRCAMTGRVVDGSGDAIWDDGEWISWEWINGQLYEQELAAKYPHGDIEIVRIFEELVSLATHYKNVTGRYLPIFGELGELFAEITLGMKRHKPYTAGSDGRLGNDFIEVKTITPEKREKKVLVKRKGNFNKLLVVKVDEEFNFEARMLDRKNMEKQSGKLATVSWSSINIRNNREKNT